MKCAAAMTLNTTLCLQTFALTFENWWLMCTSSGSLPHQWQVLGTSWKKKNAINYNVCLSHKLRFVRLQTSTRHHSGSCRNLGHAKQIEEGSHLKNGVIKFIIQIWLSYVGEKNGWWFVAGTIQVEISWMVHCTVLTDILWKFRLTWDVF